VRALPRTCAPRSFRLLLLVALLSAPTVAAAPSHLIGLSLMSGGAQVRDLNFNRTRYAGFEPGAQLEYRFDAEGERVSASLGASSASIENGAGYPLLLIDPLFELAWTRCIWKNASGRLKLFAGGAFESAPRLYNFEVEDPDHLNWFTSHALGPKLAGTFEFDDRWSLSAELTVPLVALVSRPPAEVDRDVDKPDVGYLLARAHDGAELATLNHFRGIDLEVGAELKTGDRIVHRLAWRLDAATATQPRPVHRLDQSVLFSILFRL